MTPQEAARELLRRRRARASLIDYANAIDVPGKPLSDDEDGWLFKPVETSVAAHHRLMLSAIERTMGKPHGRLMLFLPPGSAKSTYASVVAPTWYMGANPRKQVILASYGSDLARKHGRRARQIVRSKKYTSIFGCEISSDTSAADEWALTNGSEYMAGGLLSGLTGNRAHGILIDDPIKGREEADSPVIRKKTLEAYQDDLQTRLIPGGWIILVQTRWHEADLAGSILPETYNGESGEILCRDGQKWEVLCIPAEAERDDDPLGRKRGEMLWPEWFDERHWSVYRANPRTWAALYQQRPRPDTGGYFKTEAIHRGGLIPKNLIYIGATDGATTIDGGDYTEHGIIGIDEKGEWWPVDWWYGQKSSDVWVERKIDLMQKWKPAIWFDEKGPIHNAVHPFLLKRMQERRVYCRLETLPSMVSKELRAEGLRGMVAMGMLHVPETEWGARLIDQMQAFPVGVSDDGVDVLSLAARGQSQFGKAIKPRNKLTSQPEMPAGVVRVVDLEKREVAQQSRYKL